MHSIKTQGRALEILSGGMELRLDKLIQKPNLTKQEVGCQIDFNLSQWELKLSLGRKPDDRS